MNKAENNNSINFEELTSEKNKKIYKDINIHFVGYCTLELVDSIISNLGNDTLLSMFLTLDNEIESAKRIEEEILMIIQSELSLFENCTVTENFISSVQKGMETQKAKWAKKGYFSLKGYTYSSSLLSNHVNILNLYFDTERLLSNLYSVNDENRREKMKIANKNHTLLDYSYLNKSKKTIAKKEIVIDSNYSLELDYVAIFEEIMYYSYNELKKMLVIEKMA